MKNKQLLLTWDAYNNGFVVTAKVLEMLLKVHKTPIDEILYLQNQNLSKENLAEIDVFFARKNYREVLSKFDTEKQLNRLKDCYRIKEYFELENVKTPKFTNKNVKIKSVTDYQSIYNSLIEILKSIDTDKVDLHINVSPGTPQMHVVWLMLNSAGFLPVNTTLWSSQWDKNKAKTTLEKITFKPNTFLSDVLKKKHLKISIPNINPNETLSKARQVAEQKIKIFSHIPNAPILLLGERGTGKSTYVRTLIRNTVENDYPFAELACGTFSEELMRSELFGYKKGAFTGATNDKKGILANFKKEGILFLDEIQDLSKPLQRQLIQVLQTGEYFPLGASSPEKANFRLITASNNSYNKLANKKLDRDFLDRTSRFIVEIPPLRNCTEDFKNYWESVWKEVASFENSPTIIWNDTIFNFLKNQELKGNFRDLQKLASYIIAFYYENKNTNIAIIKAFDEFSKWEQLNNQKDGYFMPNKTYNEIIAKFNKDLAKWAIKKYGSKKAAGKQLKRSDSMLSKDLNMDRLNKH